MTIEEKRRELFELRIIEEANRRVYAHMGCVLKRDSIGGYATTWVDMAWLGFNAALDAVLIELPTERSLSASDDPWYVRELCIDAIESTGLGLKVNA